MRQPSKNFYLPGGCAKYKFDWVFKVLVSVWVELAGKGGINSLRNSCFGGGGIHHHLVIRRKIDHFSGLSG